MVNNSANQCFKKDIGIKCLTQRQAQRRMGEKLGTLVVGNVCEYRGVYIVRLKPYHEQFCNYSVKIKVNIIMVVR